MKTYSQMTTTREVIPIPQTQEENKMLHISDFIIVGLAIFLSGAIFSPEGWTVFVALSGSFVGGVMLWRFRRQKTFGENLLQAGSAGAGGIILAWVMIEYFAVDKPSYIAGINALCALSVNTIVDAYLVVAEKQSFVVIIRNFFTIFTKQLPQGEEQEFRQRGKMKPRERPLQKVNRPDTEKESVE